MTVYVDEERTWQADRTNWSHLWADTEEELDRWVTEICQKRCDPKWLNPAWKHYSKGLSGDFIHYDVTPRKRAEALKMGAKFIPLRTWIKRRTEGKSTRDDNENAV